MPKGVQDAITIKSIYEDGIFKVGKDKYLSHISLLILIMRLPVKKIKKQYSWNIQNFLTLLIVEQPQRSQLIIED